jgi:kynurenine aminotransferase
MVMLSRHLSSATRRLISSSSSRMRQDPFKPAARVAGQKQDVWSIVNEAAASSKVADVLNMG